MFNLLKLVFYICPLKTRCNLYWTRCILYLPHLNSIPLISFQVKIAIIHLQVITFYEIVTNLCYIVLCYLFVLHIYEFISKIDLIVYSGGAMRGINDCWRCSARQFDIQRTVWGSTCRLSSHSDKRDSKGKSCLLLGGI